MTRICFTFIRVGSLKATCCCTSGVTGTCAATRSTLPSGKKVVVVDDSLVRGTTSRELVQMIRQAGEKEVHFRVASVPITGPCYYGIDTPTKAELIASSHSLEEIRQHLGVETLGYLSLDGMLRAMGGDATEFCHACFSGDYPTAIPDDTPKARHATPLQVTMAV